MLQSRVNPNFLYSRPNRRHRLPVKRVQALLDTPELKPCLSSGVSGERSNVAARSAKPLDQLTGHGTIYEYSYIVSTPERTSRITMRCSRRTAAARQEGPWCPGPLFAAERERYANPTRRP
jgi:hypothetical protein